MLFLCFAGNPSLVRSFKNLLHQPFASLSIQKLLQQVSSTPAGVAKCKMGIEQWGFNEAQKTMYVNFAYLRSILTLLAVIYFNIRCLGTYIYLKK